MTHLLLALCLSSVTLVTSGGIHQHASNVDGHTLEKPDRCAGIEFDAITPDEQGKPFYFKDGYLWNGFHGLVQLANKTFNHPGHVDAAFLMPRAGNPEDRDYVYLFQGELAFRYHNHTLDEGYPKEIKQEFPGVPSHLDAAVECPKGECFVDSVLFFEGSEVYQYDIGARRTKRKVWPDVPACTAAFRWLEHYYCFHGNNFTRFHQVTGAVERVYPKDARHYFMQCSNFGHGGHYQPPKCSEVSLDAITSDNAGKTYIFTGPLYMRLDMRQDGIHAFPMNRMWKEVVGGVNAVFSFEDRIYLIKGDQVYIYRSGAHYTLIQGYPKSLQEELGIQGPTVDAAFACAGQHTVHIIQGNKMVEVDLLATPRTLSPEALLPVPRVDAALCGPRGVRLFSGHQYYEYESPDALRQSRFAQPLNITAAMMGCRD